MNPPELLQRLFSSKEFLFLFYTFGFGIFIQLIPPGEKPFSWVLVLAFGVPFGLVMTYMTHKQIKKQMGLTGLTELNQQIKLSTAARTGILPDDTEVRKALPAYLENQLQTLQRTARQGRAWILVMIAVSLLMATGDGNSFMYIMTAFFSIMLVATHFSIRKAAVRMRNLYEQLRSTREGSKLAPLPEDDAASSAFMTKRQWIVAGIIIGLIAALTLVAQPAPTPEEAANSEY